MEETKVSLKLLIDRKNQKSTLCRSGQGFRRLPLSHSGPSGRFLHAASQKARNGGQLP